MSWSNVSLETDTWTDTADQALFVQDQNEDILESQGGSPVMTQNMGSGTNWSDIS